MRLPKHPTLLRRLRDARVRQFVARCPPRPAARFFTAANAGH
ncbi:MAG: hypothetical protein NTU94_03480 [Planctomycetota bacterium]|nr:hypothetical protein [Planctomycetota bacterium]